MRTAHRMPRPEGSSFRTDSRLWIVRKSTQSNSSSGQPVEAGVSEAPRRSRTAALEFAGFRVDLDVVADFHEGGDLHLMLGVLQDRGLGDLSRRIAAGHRLGVFHFP